MAKDSPMTSISKTERLLSSNSDEDGNEDGAQESTAHAHQCVLPAVLRDRPPGGRGGAGGRGAPPPVPPRSPRRPTDASSSRGGH